MDRTVQLVKVRVVVCIIPGLFLLRFRGLVSGCSWLCIGLGAGAVNRWRWLLGVAGLAGLHVLHTQEGCLLIGSSSSSSSIRCVCCTCVSWTCD